MRGTSDNNAFVANRRDIKFNQQQAEPRKKQLSRVLPSLPPPSLPPGPARSRQKQGGGRTRLTAAAAAAYQPTTTTTL